jgi:hypothetical protein
MSDARAKEIQRQQGPQGAIDAMTPRQLSAACASSFNDEPELKRKYEEYVLAHSMQLRQLIRAARS